MQTPPSSRRALSFAQQRSTGTPPLSFAHQRPSAPTPQLSFAQLRSSETTRHLGANGEDLTAAWYQDRGYRLVDRNWRTRNGELDLIVRGHGRLVFCEVKTRRSAKFGHPAAAVTEPKQQRIRKLALQWLKSHPGGHGQLRFDVAAVTPRGIEVIEAAF